jgi:nicotinamide-nucleotide amidase
MNACIIAVGSELLTPLRIDTNSLAITERLNTIGCDVRMKAVVGDDIDELARVLQAALERMDVVVCTGGLGPTADDLTRDAVARVLGAPLDVDERIVDQIRERFARRGMQMPDINRRQAMVPRGAVVLDNPKGSAPGLWIEHGRTALVLLPGPPREMTPMFDAVVRDRLAPRAGGAGLFRRVLKMTGRSESDVDTLAAPIYTRWLGRTPPIQTTILAVSGQIELHLTVRAATAEEANTMLEPAARELSDVLGDVVYTTHGRSLETVVGEQLRARRLTVAIAESCTGGLLASRLTDVPGSSDYIERGAVCYSNRAKIEWLGVPEALIAAHGAVSEPVASAMAAGVRDRAGTHIGIGVTGIAGPGGGTEAKPVGMVCIAVVVQSGSHTMERVRTFQFLGGRELVKFQSATAAMNMLRLMLLRDVGL